MIVADANLIVGRCIKTVDTELANLVFQKDRIWHAPNLWRVEFVSTLRKYEKANLLSEQKRIRAFYFAQSMMRDMDHDSNIHEVYRVVNTIKCSAYDSCYIALAEERGVKLVTVDGGILANAPHIALSPEQFLAA